MPFEFNGKRQGNAPAFMKHTFHKITAWLKGEDYDPAQDDMGQYAYAQEPSYQNEASAAAYAQQQSYAQNPPMQPSYPQNPAAQSGSMQQNPMQDMYEEEEQVLFNYNTLGSEFNASNSPFKKFWNKLQNKLPRQQKREHLRSNQANAVQAPGQNAMPAEPYQGYGQGPAYEQPVPAAPSVQSAQSAPVYAVNVCDMRSCIEAINPIKDGSCVLITINEIINQSDVKRYIDLIQGACFALGVNLNRLSKDNNFFIAWPQGVDLRLDSKTQEAQMNIYGDYSIGTPVFYNASAFAQQQAQSAPFMNSFAQGYGETYSMQQPQPISFPPTNPSYMN